MNYVSLFCAQTNAEYIYGESESERARENVKWYWRAIFSYLHSEMNGKQWDEARCYATQCKRGVERNSMAKNVHVNDLAPNRWLVLLKESFHFLVKHDGFTVRCKECLFSGWGETRLSKWNISHARALILPSGISAIFIIHFHPFTALPHTLDSRSRPFICTSLFFNFKLNAHNGHHRLMNEHKNWLFNVANTLLLLLMYIIDCFSMIFRC